MRIVNNLIKPPPTGGAFRVHLLEFSQNDIIPISWLQRFDEPTKSPHEHFIHVYYKYLTFNSSIIQ